MKISVRLHDFGKSNVSDLAQKAHDIGFDMVQVALNKCFDDYTAEPGTINSKIAKDVKDEFAKYNLSISTLGAYFNPVHSNKESIINNILKFKEHLKYANEFGTKYVGSETGSFNDDKWTYNPLNRTEEAYQQIKEVFNDLAVYAKEVNSYVAIEGAAGHCMYDPKTLKRLLNDIDNGHVNVIMDTYNWLDLENHEKHKEIFDECLELFGDKIVVFHLKDYIIAETKLKQVGLGKGLMDLEYIIPRMKKYCPNAVLTFEGVMPDDMKSSLELVKRLIK